MPNRPAIRWARDPEFREVDRALQAAAEEEAGQRFEGMVTLEPATSP